ncbi:hypothetical protein ABT061_15815 [Streptosporangium sp. NPDC002544]|uniref:hypothetical protein n=1 Tax=Streptosporangium sp. NPDC002544 TaxID=3154538 RepID=UPI0033240C6D
MTQITHPQIPGSEVDVPESSLPFHQAAGWVIRGSQDDPEVTAAEKARDLALNGPGEQAEPPAEQDQTPKKRSTKKDGE